MAVTSPTLRREHYEANRTLLIAALDGINSSIGAYLKYTDIFDKADYNAMYDAREKMEEALFTLDAKVTANAIADNSK